MLDPSIALVYHQRLAFVSFGTDLQSQGNCTAFRDPVREHVDVKQDES